VIMWTAAEVCMSIVSACLPTLRPLFAKFNPRKATVTETLEMSRPTKPDTHIEVAQSWEVTRHQRWDFQRVESNKGVAESKR
jgi:hypothetical protein